MGLFKIQLKLKFGIYVRKIKNKCCGYNLHVYHYINVINECFKKLATDMVKKNQSLRDLTLILNINEMFTTSISKLTV